MRRYAHGVLVNGCAYQTIYGCAKEKWVNLNNLLFYFFFLRFHFSILFVADQVGARIGKVRVCPTGSDSWNTRREAINLAESQRLTREHASTASNANLLHILAEAAGTGQLVASVLGCISWRNTGGCTPDGPSEPERDVGCDTQIPTGASGDCECEGGIRVAEVTCTHDR